MKKTQIILILLFGIILCLSSQQAIFKLKKLAYYDNIRLNMLEPAKEMNIDKTKFVMIEAPLFLGKTTITFLDDTELINNDYFYIINGWIKSHHPDLSKDYKINEFNQENSIFILAKENNKSFWIVIKKEDKDKINPKKNKINYIYIGGNFDRSIFLVLDII